MCEEMRARCSLKCTLQVAASGCYFVGEFVNFEKGLALVYFVLRLLSQDGENVT